jgi:hypothetical protein
MFNNVGFSGLRSVGLSVLAALAIGAPAVSSAQHFGGGGGGHGGGGGGFHGGGGGAHANYAVRGGAGAYRSGYGGYRGGYRGSYYGGYRGYYGGYRGWGYGGGWWGWPTGLFLATLPLYYSTLYWNGVPYYYADNNYYLWDGPSSRYEQVTPPNGLLNNSAPSSVGSGDAQAAELFAYPKSGQSLELQSRDRRECRDWAAAQGSGGATAAIAAATPQSADASIRAQTACLEGRGYSVK